MLNQNLLQNLSHINIEQNGPLIDVLQNLVHLNIEHNGPLIEALQNLDYDIKGSHVSDIGPGAGSRKTTTTTTVDLPVPIPELMNLDPITVTGDNDSCIGSNSCKTTTTRTTHCGLICLL